MYHLSGARLNNVPHYHYCSLVVNRMSKREGGLFAAVPSEENNAGLL